MSDNRPPAPRKYYHTALKHYYEEVGEGLVKVTTPDGKSGIFRTDGRWVEGEVTQANLHMLVWCGGPRLPEECRYIWMQTPIDIDRPSGWPETYENLLPHQMGKGGRGA